jgi:hypothetical protein
MISPNECKKGSGVSIRIERLLLDGFNFTAPEQRVFRAAFELELGRRFASGQFEASCGGAILSLPAQNIQIPKTPSPAILGEQIGATVFATFQK